MKRLGEFLRENRVTVVVATVVLLVVALAVWNYFSAGADPRVEAIRKAGYPVTFAELDAWYSAVPDAENAAVVYTNAFAQLVAPGNFQSGKTLATMLSDITLPPRGQALSAEDHVELSSLLASNQAVLRLLHSAISLNHSRYPVDLKQGANYQVPYVPRVRDATYLLASEALLHAANGETGPAVQSMAAAAHVADSLAAEPMVISQLVRINTWVFIIPRLEHFVNTSTLTDEQLAVLQKALEDAEQPKAYARAFAGERVVFLACFSDSRLQEQLLWRGSGVSNARAESFRISLLITALKLSGKFQKDREFSLETLATNLAAAEQPYPERFRLSRQSAATLRAPPSRFYIVSGLMLPALGNVYLKDAEHAARMRVAQTAVAMERYRRAHGEAMPSNLDALVPTYLSAVPLDPIDGQPLRFKQFAKGYIVYSVGTDGKDDGGAEFNPKNRSAPSDITFIVKH